MPAKHFFLLLLIAVTSHCFSQKKTGAVLSFKYKGQTFQIYRGSKISLGKGINTDGSFECSSREKVLRQRESYQAANSGYHSDKDTYVNTGEREYLPRLYSLETVTISKVTYLKKLDEYRIIIGTAEGNYNFYLMHGIKDGEVVAIDGIKLPEITPVTASGSVTAYNGVTTYDTGAVYEVKLKNGSAIKGILREAGSNNFKIETTDKNLYVFTNAEILSIKKADAATPPSFSDAGSSNIEILQSPYARGRDTMPRGCFANYTDVSFLLGNNVDASYAAKFGFGVTNMSGYLFRNCFFLGGGIGYTGCLGDTIKYHFLTFELGERFYLLRKKKVSPFFGLSEKVGTILKNISTTHGLITGLGINAGVDFKIGKKVSISPFLGYNLYLLAQVPKEAPVRDGNNYTNGFAEYFVIGAALGLHNL
jgi:hypothetical protein